MQKIEILKNYTTTDGGFYNKGAVIEVSNNVAHGLIEQGIAVLFIEEKIMKPQRDKMMRSELKDKRGYRVK